jgi:RHS repeat-associated protein
VEYFPFGETFVDERPGTYGLDFGYNFGTPYLYNGKELDEETGLYYYGARYYDPRICMFYGVDNFAEKYAYQSPFAYAGNNPILNIDVNGDSTLVTANDNGIYTVYGKGNPKGDNGIYLVDKDGNLTGTKIGESMTSHSFYDDNGNPVAGAIIDPTSTEGKDFIDKLIKDNPTLMEYIGSARAGEFNSEGNRNIYNIKEQGISERGDLTEIQYRYRGSLDEKGRIGSARDFGNFGAGMVAGRKGIGIIPARVAFDAYESYSHGNISVEGTPTRKAEHMGYWKGIKMHFGF